METTLRSYGSAALTVAGLLSLATAIGVGRFAFTPILPVMVGEGLLDVAQGGWLAAANYVGYFVGALTVARAPLRPRSLTLVALLATAVLTAMMALPSPSIWLVLRFLAGAASAWVFVTTSIWCLGALAERGDTRASGWVYAGVGVGIALVGAWCLAAAGVGLPSNILWVQLGGLALVLALPVFWASIGAENGSPAPTAESARPAERPVYPGTRGLVIAYGVMGFGYILPATFLPVLARSASDSPLAFGFAWPIFGATAALSTLLCGPLLAGVQRLRTWAACQLLMGAGVLLPALAQAPWVIASSALLVGGTFMVITLAGVQEMRGRATDAQHARTLVGRLTASFAAGQIVGPLLSAALLRLGPQGLALSLATGSLALLGTGAWLWRLPPPTSLAPEPL